MGEGAAKIKQMNDKVKRYSGATRKGRKGNLTAVLGVQHLTSTSWRLTGRNNTNEQMQTRLANSLSKSIGRLAVGEFTLEWVGRETTPPVWHCTWVKTGGHHFRGQRERQSDKPL